MKSVSTYTRSKNREYIPYPNCATRREIVDKLLNRLLIFVMCLGFAGIILFLVAMS